MPYRLRSKSWQPARLRRVDHRLIMIWMVAAAIVRGLDYLTGDDVWGARDFMLAAAPAWIWGSGFLVGGLVLLLGALTRRHLLVYVGHGWLWAAYTINALALALAASYPYMNGIRGAGATGLVALLHYIHFVRTGPAPLRISSRDDDHQTVERVVGPGEG